MPPTPSIHREVLLPTTLLFLAGVLVAVTASAVILPLATTPGQAYLPLGIVVLGDLAILYLFLRTVMRRVVLVPVDRIVEHAERITSGDLDHRIPPAGSTELDAIVDSVNTLAARLIDEKTRLAENVESLEETNRILSETSQELVRAARLASVGTLAAGVAHEIGNPLGAARAYLDVLQARVAVGRPVNDIVGELQNEVGRIDDIVRAILAFSRPLADERSGRLSGGDPGEGGDRLPTPFQGYEDMVDRIRLDLAREERFDGITVVVRIDADAPPVHAHPQHLERVLSNLARNAALALAGQPDPVLTIRIRAEPAHVPPMRSRRGDDPPSVNYSHRRRLANLLQVRGAPPPNRGDNDMVLEVSDNGPGIPADVLDELFDPFFTTREPGQGLGLGLALTARIVGELAGVVEAENRPEGGALFRVRLPGARPAETAGPPAALDGAPA
ncbi:MAG: HAMP domain-containing protein [Gemmatimonadales bacterium]|nr:MAG: HAMP domain-containing protein [Gemmatimonadales bacterium]